MQAAAMDCRLDGRSSGRPAEMVVKRGLDILLASILLVLLLPGMLLIAALVAVDTSPAHLARALGRPVSILLSYAPDWRWLLERSDTPWYPTVTLHRQDRPGAWEGALQKAVALIQSEMGVS